MNSPPPLPARVAAFRANDPYAPPAAALRSEASGSRMYSPLQVAGGAVLGGPIGLAYFLWANFRTLANERAARLTLAGGALLMAVLVVLLPILPERMPNWPITLLYLLAGRFGAERWQMTKQAIADSADYTFHSGWRVVGLGLLCLIASLVLLIGPLLALAWFGIWDPMGIMAAVVA